MINIFKASAGSGKTYRLTLEYLKFLFDSPENYRHILAVTFTNKATEEMKERIISALYKMAYTKVIPKSGSLRQIFDEIESHLGWLQNEGSDNKLRKMAEESLKVLLHDYSSFTVSTIDKFFQTAIRAFAREIGRNNSYNIELDSELVINMAIDNMLANLDKPGNEELLEWLIYFSLDSLEGGSYWDIRYILRKMALEITKPGYKNGAGVNQRTVTRENLSLLGSELKKIKADFEKRLAAIATGFVKTKSDFALEWSDFKNSARFKRFEKMAAGEYEFLPTLLNALDNFEDWLPKTAQKKNPILYSRMQDAYNSGLNNAIAELKKLIDTSEKDYLSAQNVLSNLYMLGVLADIDSYAKEYAKDNNLMLISDSEELLKKIIDGSDAPFIYEKIGSRIDNFMLDEFQDTAGMQWENFKPLIINSIAGGFNNLIVGDVKQSIYRWRGSDRELLSGSIANDIGEQNIKLSTLTINYRSSRSIVEFNSDFFLFAAEKADILFNREYNRNSDYLRNIYSDVKQELPEGKSQGYTKVIAYENEVGENGKKPWYTRATEQIPVEIEDSLSRGYSYRDINVLVRSNKEATEVINYLLSLNYPVMSADSLMLSLNGEVNTLVAALQSINSPENEIAAEVVRRRGIVLDRKELSRLNLVELCQQIAGKYLNFSSEDSIFISSFIDLVNDFTKVERGDLNSFLDWWDLNGGKKYISSPPRQDAVNVMTIHKSKGLTLAVVIIPFVDWEFKMDTNKLLWIKSQIAPYNLVQPLPIRVNSNCISTHFAEEFIDEQQKNYADILNVAYVAFTRASHEMIILVKQSDSGVPGLLLDFLKSTSGQEDNRGNVYEIGCRSSAPASDDNKEANEIPLPILRLKDPGERLRLKLKSDLYYNNPARFYGVVMHEILSQIVVEDDVQLAVDEQVLLGNLPADEKYKVINDLKAALESVRDREWFNGKFTIMNESEIVEPGGDIYRPDRILLKYGERGAVEYAEVIDFKFGNLEKNSYQKQLSKYINLLQMMGIPKVEGFIWYVTLNHILPAK